MQIVLFFYSCLSNSDSNDLITESCTSYTESKVYTQSARASTPLQILIISLLSLVCYNYNNVPKRNIY